MNIVLFSLPLSTEAPLQIALLVGWQHRAVQLGEESIGLTQRAENFYSTAKWPDDFIWSQKKVLTLAEPRLRTRTLITIKRDKTVNIIVHKSVN